MKKQKRDSNLRRYHAIYYHPLSGVQIYGFILHEGDILEANDVCPSLVGTWKSLPNIAGKPLTPNRAKYGWIRPCPLPHKG